MSRRAEDRFEVWLDRIMYSVIGILLSVTLLGAIACLIFLWGGSK